MLADPQIITIASTPVTHGRRLTGTDLGQFVAPGSSIEIQTSSGTKVRNSVRLRQTKLSADPVTSVPVTASSQISITFLRTPFGYTEADVLAQLKGLVAWLNASTDAVAKQIIAGEN